jgi:uncharacterized membrane protein (DUF373 family)
MLKIGKRFDLVYQAFFSENTRKKSEVVIVFIAIISFVLHLAVIALVDSHILQINDLSKLLTNPIAAIYTPFSFILIYEVYLLVFYLPKSTSIYIGKQYEIIMLIVIRRVFKDLSQLEFTEDWFSIKSDLNFTYDLIATIVLFLLIFAFYKLNQTRITKPKKEIQPNSELAKFIKIKNIIATCLIPILFILATYSFGHWVYESFFSISRLVGTITDVNKIFFDEFFTVLILIDVLLLLFSFLHIDKFNKVIRNSGFIISTILLKLSFSADGLLNIILIVVAVLFGVIILAIHNQFEKLDE